MKNFKELHAIAKFMRDGGIDKNKHDIYCWNFTIAGGGVKCFERRREQHLEFINLLIT
jgi:predicted urease superfamily metal-dependent hydrolase